MAPPWGSGDDGAGVRPSCDAAQHRAVDAMVAEARMLGEAWLADDCSFCDVTLGMAALSRRMIAGERRPTRAAPIGRVLISPMPGDQHSFGCQLVGVVLREAGWEVVADVAADEEALIAAVAGERLDAVGLSVGHERALDRVAPLVRALRRAAPREIVVALGGAMLNDAPDRARALGADVHVDDARDLSEALLARMLVPA